MRHRIFILQTSVQCQHGLKSLSRNLGCRPLHLRSYARGCIPPLPTRHVHHIDLVGHVDVARDDCVDTLLEVDIIVVVIVVVAIDIIEDETDDKVEVYLLILLLILATASKIVKVIPANLNLLLEDGK